MLLTEPGGVEHIIRFVRGAPVKVRPGDGYALFGDLLVEDGILSRVTLDEALATRGLLGDVLLLTGCVDAATLDWVAETQFVRRMVHLFELPVGTTYRYFDGDAALEAWGGEPARVDPLRILWAGLREHGERSSRMQPALERLGDAPIRLHPALDPGRFGLRHTEIAALARAREDAPSLAALIASGVAPEALVRKLVYALLITRFVDLGVAYHPVGVEEGAAASVTGRTLARMQLRSVSYRVGAAAPDVAGDGERGPASPRTMRKRKGGAGEGSDPAPAEKAGAEAPPERPSSGGWQPPGERDSSEGWQPPGEQDSDVRAIEEGAEDGVPSSSLRLAGVQPGPTPGGLRSPLSKG